MFRLIGRIENFFGFRVPLGGLFRIKRDNGELPEGGGTGWQWGANSWESGESYEVRI